MVDILKFDYLVGRLSGVSGWPVNPSTPAREHQWAERTKSVRNRLQLRRQIENAIHLRLCSRVQTRRYQEASSYLEKRTKCRGHWLKSKWGVWSKSRLSRYTALMHACSREQCPALNVTSRIDLYTSTSFTGASSLFFSATIISMSTEPHRKKQISDERRRQNKRAQKNYRKPEHAGNGKSLQG
jgi:hypothetical protein